MLIQLSIQLAVIHHIFYKLYVLCLDAFNKKINKIIFSRNLTKNCVKLTFLKHLFLQQLLINFHNNMRELCFYRTSKMKLDEENSSFEKYLFPDILYFYYSFFLRLCLNLFTFFDSSISLEIFRLCSKIF